MQGFTEADVTNQTGKTFVVTGANSGLGFETSRVLAARGARVILACRSEAKAEQAMARIRELTPGADLAFLAYDQGDLDSINAAAATLVAGPCIDVLINNAGVMQPKLARTKQGFEQHFGINHLESFAFTGLLLSKFSQAPSPRIVITGSLSHKTGVIDFDDLNAEKGYDRSPRYDDSKLANLLFLFELDRRLRAAHSPITAVGCHPGLAMTSLAKSMTMLRLLIPIFKLLRFNTAAMGAWPASPGGHERRHPRRLLRPDWICRFERRFRPVGPLPECGRCERRRETLGSIG